MEVVAEAEADEVALRVQELVVNVHEEDVLAVVQARDDPAHLLLDLGAVRVGRPCAAGDDGQQDLRVGEVFWQFQDVCRCSTSRSTPLPPDAATIWSNAARACSRPAAASGLGTAKRLREVDGLYRPAA